MTEPKTASWMEASMSIWRAGTRQCECGMRGSPVVSDEDPVDEDTSSSVAVVEEVKGILFTSSGPACDAAEKRVTSTNSDISDKKFLANVQQQIATHRYGDGREGKKNYDSEKDRPLNEILAHALAIHEQKVPDSHPAALFVPGLQLRPC